MSITRKIIESISGKSPTIGGNICALCGGEETVTEWYSTKKILSGNFTDYNQMVMKTSKVLCSFCKDALSDDFISSPKGSRCGIRLFSFLIEKNQFIKIDYSEKADYLFNYQFTPPFILVFSSTGQKHISFKALESNDPEAFWVCSDFGNIWFERRKWQPVFEIANNFFQNKVTRTELEQCSVAPWKYRKYNLDFRGIKKLVPHRNKEQYKLIISVLQKEKQECESKPES